MNCILKAMRNYFLFSLFLFSLPFGGQSRCAGLSQLVLSARLLLLLFLMVNGCWGWAQPNNFKPGPNKMVINLEASTQKFEVPVKDVKTKVNNERTYSWYKSNQIMQTKGGYDGKLLHGVFSEFYLNNNLKEKGSFKKGLKNGEWKSWYEDGQLKAIVKYCNGLNHGNYKSYNEKGELILEAKYKKGKFHGETISFENGKVFAVHKYKKGNEVFPKPKKIKEEKKKNSSWKFWKRDTTPANAASGEENPAEKPLEKQPENKVKEKKKVKGVKETEKKNSGDKKEEKKEPEKKASPKEPKTSNG